MAAAFIPGDTTLANAPHYQDIDTESAPREPQPIERGTRVFRFCGPDRTSPIVTGTVQRIYSRRSRFGYTTEMARVRWDEPDNYYVSQYGSFEVETLYNLDDLEDASLAEITSCGECGRRLTLIEYRRASLCTDCDVEARRRMAAEGIESFDDMPF